MKLTFEIENLQAWFGKHQILKGISLNIFEHQVMAIIGPSGCGKSTFIRCLNRMHEVTPHATFSGKILLDGKPTHGPGTDPVLLRRQVGMVFQKPNPFPTKSIFQNVAAGLVLNGWRGKTEIEESVIESLKKASLWEEVKDNLHKPATSLSGGQQQRLCIARTLAVNPEVILMDEPCSALDPIATARIEELIEELKSRVTIVIVTHNMQQAARVSDVTAFLYMGELVECGETQEVFTNPKQKKTEDYITGRFG